MNNKNTLYYIEGLGEDTIPVGAYCSPQPAVSVGGIDYPSKITYEHYKALAELGVNIVYGHAEVIGRSNEKAVFEALELCERVGIKYLVRDVIAEEYVSLGYREYKDWRTLSATDKAGLNERFKASIGRYKDYSAFAGISFYDEPGYDSFEGIAEAKSVFCEVCPDKLFYVNMLPNNIMAKQLQYGANTTGVPDCTVDQLLEKHTNDLRYHYFLKKYIETVKPEVFSYDSYPFISLEGLESMHHISLYELQQLAGWSEQEYGIPYWLFMQIGGQWEGSNARVTDYAEMMLQFNISLAYGAKGIQLFPACFPNDWLHDDIAVGGVIGRFGEKTDHYHLTKLAIKQVKACGKYLMHARLRKSIVSGDFCGLLPPEESLQKIMWNETIFRGKLPTFNNNETDSYRELKSVEGIGSQFFVGCFDYEDSGLFYVVNNSIVTAGNVRLTFDKTSKLEIIYKGESKTVTGCELYYQRVGAGEGFLVRVAE